MQEEINKALNVLKSGGLLLYPTDTIWGIGCDATNEKAVEKIYALKRRHDSKSMIVLLDNDNKLGRYVSEIPNVAWDLLQSEEPLTIIYPSAINLAINVVAEDGSIGIRITKDEFCRQLIYQFRKPIVSTSANISGLPSPAYFKEISKEILSGVDHVVNLRQDETTKRKPSSIIKLGTGNQIEIIRK